MAALITTTRGSQTEYRLVRIRATDDVILGQFMILSLAAVVHRVVIEGVDGNRRGPLTMVLELVGRRITCVFPGTDRMRLRIVRPDGHVGLTAHSRDGEAADTYLHGLTS
jgi:hypothetical protein